EGDRRAGGEHPFPAGEVELDVVGLDVDQRRALGGLLAGEVLSGHGDSFCATVAGGGTTASILPRRRRATHAHSAAVGVEPSPRRCGVPDRPSVVKRYR